MLIEASEQELDRLRNAVELVEEVLATAPAVEVATPPDTVETHWVKVTSTTLQDGRYPGTRYNVTADGFTADETCWIATPNGETLSLNKFYLGKLVDDVSNVAVYEWVGPSSCGITVGETEVFDANAGGVLFNDGGVLGSATNVEISSGGNLIIATTSEPADGELANNQFTLWVS
jgi:hypothetical protein